MGSINFNSDNPYVDSSIWGRKLDAEQIAQKSERQNRAKILFKELPQEINNENDSKEIGLG